MSMKNQGKSTLKRVLSKHKEPPNMRDDSKAKIQKDTAVNNKRAEREREREREKEKEKNDK